MKTILPQLLLRTAFISRMHPPGLFRGSIYTLLFFFSCQFSCAQELAITYIGRTKFCAGTSGTFTLAFASTLNFADDNQFSLELSNSNGDFSSGATVIGDIEMAGPGEMIVRMPAISLPGVDYRLRLISSNPTYTGSSSSENLVIYSLPVISLGGDFNVCSGESTVITANGAESYTWSNGLGSGSAVEIQPSSTSTYQVTGVNAAGCSSTIEFTINLQTLEADIIPGSTSVSCNASTTIAIKSSEVGVRYTLKKYDDNTVVAGPVSGTGSGISFSTGPLTASTKFKVVAAEQSSYLNFTQSRNYVSIPASTGINEQFSTNAVTIEGWFYPTEVPDGNPILIGRSMTSKGGIKENNLKSGENSMVSFAMYMDGAVAKAGFISESFTNALSVPITIGVWQHLACTFDGNIVRLYQNGVQVSSMSVPGVELSGEADWVLGQPWEAEKTGASDHFKGRMDEIRIWNKARTAAQIAAGMTGCPEVNSKGLVAYYTFDVESKGKEKGKIQDITGHGFDGELNHFNPNSTWIEGGKSCYCSSELSGYPMISVSTPTVEKPVADVTSFCVEGTGILRISKSDTSYNYYLKNANDQSIVGEAVVGTGSSLAFSTGELSSTATFYVSAEHRQNPACSTTSESLTLTVVPLPVITNTASAPGCPGTQLQLLATAGDAEVQWFEQEEGGLPIAAGEIFLTPVLAASKTYFAQAVLQGCTSSRTKVEAVIHQQQEEVAMVEIPALCANHTPVTLQTTAPLDGNFSGPGVDEGNFDPSIAGAGNHTLAFTYESSINGCIYSASTEVLVLALPEVQLADPGAVCLNAAALQLTGGIPAGGTYSGNGIQHNLFYPELVGTGNHTITYKVWGEESNGVTCFNTAEAIVIVNPVPVPLVTSPSFKVCEGLTVHLSTGSFNSYRWLNNGAVIEGAAGKSFSTQIPGQYAVQVTDANGCTGESAPASVSIYPSPEPIISFTGVPAFCSDGGMTLGTSEFASYQWKLNGVNIEGGTGSSFTVKTAGTYTVEVTSPQKCKGSSAAVTVNEGSFVAISVSGPVHICQGSEVGLFGPAAVSYQWFFNGAVIPGATLATYAAKQAGSYTLKATDQSGCTATSAPVTVTVYNVQEPRIMNPADISLCSGAVVTLRTEKSFASYQWKRNGIRISGASYYSYKTGVEGKYLVTVLDSNGCHATSAPVVVSVNKPLVSTVPEGLAYFCSNEEALLTASGSSSGSYQWFRDGAPVAGANGSALIAMQEGNYKVVFTDAQNCSITSSLVIIRHNPAPEKPVISVSAELLLTSSHPSGNQWFRNGEPIPDATNAGYQVTENGDYFVVVQGDNGCSERSETVAISNVGIVSYNGGEAFSLGPVPFDNSLVLTADQPLAISICDASGRSLFERSCDRGIQEIPLPDFAPGIYFARISLRNSSDVHMIRLLK